MIIHRLWTSLLLFFISDGLTYTLETRLDPLQNIVYDLPDLTKTYPDNGEQITLKAYKTKDNDQLEQKPSTQSQMRWVSTGRPRLKEVASFQNSQQASLFQTDSRTQISVFFEMLTEKERNILKDYVKQTRNLNVETTSFLDMPFRSLKCSVKVFNEETGKILTLLGESKDLLTSPYEIKFQYVRNSPERLLFEEAIRNLNLEPLDLECTITNGAEIKRSNVFSISLQQSNSINLVDNLFGPADETYVTRNQTTLLANEVYTKLNVQEDYRVPEEQFDKDFVNDFISSVSNSGTFNEVSFDDALQSFSKYSLQFNGDLNPNVVKREMASFFKIEKLGNKSRIVFDTAYYEKLEEEANKSGKGSASISVFGAGKGQASASYAESQASNWEIDESSLSDQLSDLNTYSESDFKYEFEGERIIPKTIKVSKIQSSSFKKDLTFSRIKNYYTQAEFEATFSMSTRQTSLVSDQIADLEYRVRNRFPNQFIGVIFNNDYFDESGRGFDKMEGWYI